MTFKSGKTIFKSEIFKSEIFKSKICTIIIYYRIIFHNFHSIKTDNIIFCNYDLIFYYLFIIVSTYNTKRYFIKKY